LKKLLNIKKIRFSRKNRKYFKKKIGNIRSLKKKWHQGKKHIGTLWIEERILEVQHRIAVRIKMLKTLLVVIKNLIIQLDQI